MKKYKIIESINHKSLEAEINREVENYSRISKMKIEVASIDIQKDRCCACLSFEE